MRILLSNDDGIHAPGIRALWEALSDMADILVVAPDTEQSAVGHAITISDPIKASEVHENGRLFGYAIGGTPADAVKLAVTMLMDEPPDLVVSGINHGPNPGISVIYSGTVSAATEGTILGIPSMAVSIDTFGEAHWETAQHAARVVAEELQKNGLPEDTLLNVNVPNVPLNELKGFRVTTMGRSRFVEQFHRRTDPKGKDYFWMDGNMVLLNEQPESDIHALREGFVSLTPIGLDLTQHGALDHVRGWTLE